MKNKHSLRKFTLIAFATLTVLSMFGCDGCNGGGGTGGGSGSLAFKVHTTIMVNGFTNDESGVVVGGSVPLFGIVLANSCSQNPGGINNFGPVSTDSTGHVTVSNAAIGPSCTWVFNRDVSAQCPVPTVNDQVNVTFPGQEVPLPCGVSVNTFSANPAKFDPSVPPTTITITGQNMTATYAMPKVDVYDQNRTQWLEVTATSVSSDGTTLVFPASQITFALGEYVAVVSVLQSDGTTWQPVGGARIDLAVPPPPPPTGGGGCTGRNCLPQC